VNKSIFEGPFRPNIIYLKPNAFLILEADVGGNIAHELRLGRFFLLPLRAPRALHMCTSESRAERTLSKPKENPHPLKIKMTVKTPIGVILVVILIRTETTLDHSQKAEKVCP